MVFDKPKDFVRSLVEVMDWKKMLIRDVHMALRNQHQKVHGNQKPPFSKSMVERVLEEVREDATKATRNKGSLGPQHGGRRVEHLTVTLTEGKGVENRDLRDLQWERYK